MKVTVTPIGTSAVAFAGETSCLLVEVGGTRILLDVGTNPARSLTDAGVSTLDINSVYLSHVHADHIQGLPSLVFTRSVQARSASTPPKALNILAQPEVLQPAQTVLESLYPDRDFDVDWVDLSKGPFTNDGVEVSTFTASHTVPSFGAVIADQGGARKLVGYTSDTEMTPEVVEGCAGVQVLIVECFGTRGDFGEMAASAKHLCADDASHLAEAIKPRMAIPYHMHAPYRQRERRDQLEAELRSSFPGPWSYPVPGEAIAVDLP
jgi:ribonuclease Z